MFTGGASGPAFLPSTALSSALASVVDMGKLRGQQIEWVSFSENLWPSIDATLIVILTFPHGK